MDAGFQHQRDPNRRGLVEPEQRGFMLLPPMSGWVQPRESPMGVPTETLRARCPLPIYVGAASFGPFALEVTCVFFRSRANAHQDAALLESLLVMLHALLRNARADQRTHETTGRTACTSTGQRGRQRSRYD